MGDSEAILRWLVVLSVVSFAVAPLTWWLGEGLGNARHGLTRSMGIVLVTAALWWPASVTGLPFVRESLVLVVVLMGIASWTWWWRGAREVNVRSLLVCEIVWIVLFLGYALFRSYNPDIANTEKPMEIALLSSVSRSGDVPAPDPWFAGEAINYYYFGYQVIGSMVKLSGVPPSIAFNLALATLFASLGTTVAAAGFRLASSFGVRGALASLAAVLATFSLLVAGNLESAMRLIRTPRETLEPGWWYDDVGWQASRIIVDHGVHGSPDPVQTINEFPAFSFVLGDLHPHVLTYPLLLSIVVFVVGFAISPATFTSARVTVIGSLIGLLYVSNSWDAPLGVLVLFGALVLTFGFRSRQTWSRIGIAGVAALVTALPFLLHFTAPVGIESSELPGAIRSLPILGNILRTLGVVTWRPSSATELLIVHGHWLVAFAIFVCFAIRTSAATRSPLRSRFDLIALLLLTTLVFAVLWVPALLLIGIPLALAVTIVMRDARRSVQAISGLFATGFFLVLIPEFVYIQDVFANRMNTVFKLYFQAWLVFSLATSTGLSIVLASISRRALYGLAPVVVTLALAVSPYLPLSARDWTADFAGRRGLNGADYIARVSPDEAAAIDWLRANRQADTVIVEGPGCSYGTLSGLPMNRMSAFSGVPTIIGWAGHEDQWRRGETNPIRERVENRQAVAYSWLAGQPVSDTDLPNPDYIVLGTLEAAGSDDCSALIAHDVEASATALTEEGWQRVYVSEDVVILGKNSP